MSYDIAGPTGCWFRHRARDGVLETFYNYDRKQEALMGFIGMAIERAGRDYAAGGSSESRFRLLDSFFTTMSPDQMHDMMREVLLRASENRPIQVLLANPWSEFALARSQSLQRRAYPMQEIRRGLHNIHSVLAGKYPEDVAEDLLDIPTLVSKIESYSSPSFLGLRFYDKVPSGPMFFFGSILVYGRFCAGRNSNGLPWTMIVKDPFCEGDLYSVYSEEFDRLWEQAKFRPPALDSKDAWLTEDCSEKVDPTTSLLDRSVFDDHLERALSNVSQDRPLSLVFVDIDRFKKVNDTYGHTNGDKVLRVVGEAMQRVIDRRGRSYRYGGEELVALLPAFDEEESASTGERIRRTIGGLTFEDIPELRVTVSVGVATRVRSEPDGGPTAFVKRADDALYAAKDGGRDRVYRASDLDAQAPLGMA